MPAPKQSAADILSLITERAEALRKAGVTSVAVDNFSVQLAPWSEPPAQQPPSKPEEVFTDPLQDPATYPNGRVPGFVREEDEGDAA